MDGRHPYLAASWPDSVFDALRSLRRDAARQEADEDYRPVKKSYQRRVKAATILLNYFDGKPVDFPAELDFDMIALMDKATHHVMVEAQ